MVGAEIFDTGLRVRVHKEQKIGDGERVNGSFELLDAGTGTYSEALAEFVGQVFMSAKEMIDQVAGISGAQKCTHIVNCNNL